MTNFLFLFFITAGLTSLTGLGNDDSTSSDLDDPDAPLEPQEDDPDAPLEPQEFDDGTRLENGIFFGTDGNDNLYIARSTHPVLADGNEVTEIRGGDGGDLISGFLSGASVLDGGAGDDTITSVDGQTVYGGPGNDEIRTGYSLPASAYVSPNVPPNLTLSGAATLTGGEGDDVFLFNPSTGTTNGDTLIITDYEHGHDVIRLNGFTGPDSANSLRIEDDGQDAVISFDSYAHNTGVQGQAEPQQIRVVGAAGLTLQDLEFRGFGLVDGSDGDDTLSSDLHGPLQRSDWGGILRAFAGDDHITIAQSSGYSLISAGEGDDTVLGTLSRNNDRLYLGAGDDLVQSSGGAETKIFGEEGNDTITHENGRSEIHAGAGNDIVTGSNMSILSGGPGNDEINVLNQIAAQSTGFVSARVFGGEGDDTVNGSTTADNIREDYRSPPYGYTDPIQDDDLYRGGDGNDTIVHSFGNDTLLGEGGDDRLFAGENAPEDQGKALFDGGDGNDSLTGSVGAGDTLLGGAGNDLLVSAYDLENIRQIGGDPSELHYVHAVGDDTAETMNGGSGDDTIIFDRNDAVSGGEGADDFRLTMHNPVTDGTGTGTSEVADFDRSEDILSIFVDELAADTLTIENGSDSSTVFMNGSPVMVVLGVPDLSMADIAVLDAGPISERLNLELIY
jgi:Ca2+-binding RTX toxin-like protein